MKLDVLKIPSGGVELAALRYRPEPLTRGTLIVYAHGFTSAKHSMDGLAAYLAGHGYEGLSFDFVGHKLGGSGGEMREPADAVRNLSDVVDWVRNSVDCRQIVIVGHSLGGLCALCVAALEREMHGPAQPPLAGIACLCVTDRPGSAFAGPIGGAIARQRADYVAGTEAMDFLQRVEGLSEAARHLDGLPALFLAGTRDIIAPPEHVRALAARAGAGATVVEVGSSHVDAPARSRAALLDWLERNGL